MKSKKKNAQPKPNQQKVRQAHALAEQVGGLMSKIESLIEESGLKGSEVEDGFFDALDKVNFVETLLDEMVDGRPEPFSAHERCKELLESFENPEIREIHAKDLKEFAFCGGITRQAPYGEAAIIKGASYRLQELKLLQSPDFQKWLSDVIKWAEEKISGGRD